MSERKLEGKFANRQQEQKRGDLLGERARRKQERWRKGGGENLCPCGQTTQKLERYKLIKMHSVPPSYPRSYPSLFLSLVLVLTLLPSITALEAGGSQLSDVLGACVRLPEVTAAIFS